jgi:3-phosphoglycerate kinase
MLANIIGKVDVLLIGGGMANTFFKAQGYQVGDSLYEEEAWRQRVSSYSLALPIFNYPLML